MTSQGIQYHKATAVELYESGVSIHLPGAAFFSDIDFPGFVLSGLDVEMLLQTAGITPLPYSTLAGTPGRLANREIKLFRTCHSFVDDREGYDLKAIWVGITGPQSLDIYVLGQWDDKQPMIEHFTYSGPYAVQWVVTDIPDFITADDKPS